MLRRTDKTLAMYQANAKTATSVIPSTVQGLSQGTLSSGSTTSATSSGATPSPTKSAGVEARGGVKWTVVAITGVVAAVFGSLIV